MIWPTGEQGEQRPMFLAGVELNPVRALRAALGAESVLTRGTQEASKNLISQWLETAKHDPCRK